MKDVVDLILADHTELKSVFGKLKDGDAGTRALLMPVAASLLTAHSRAEESEVYPVVRDEANDAEDVEHSQEEHVAAEQILVKLAGLDPASPNFPSVLDELVEAVTHHMEEEESSVLPAMRKGLSDDRRAKLGDAFLAARSEHWSDQPGAPTKADLATQANNADIDNRSTMNKEELKDAVAGVAEL